MWGITPMPKTRNKWSSFAFNRYGRTHFKLVFLSFPYNGFTLFTNSPMLNYVSIVPQTPSRDNKAIPVQFPR